MRCHSGKHVLRVETNFTVLCVIFTVVCAVIVKNSVLLQIRRESQNAAAESTLIEDRRHAYNISLTCHAP